MFGKKTRDREDFHDEIQAHIQIEADRLAAEGMDRGEALDAARRSFGNATQSRERFYESSRWMWLDHLSRDVRYALRQLALRPVFTAVATLTLALGIAASTAIFSVVYGVLLAPLPDAHPERLAQVLLVNPNDGDVSDILTGMDFLDLRDHVPAFEAIACIYNYRQTGFNLETPGGTRRVHSLQVSSAYFDVYGVAPILGRKFRAAEESDEVRVTILSHGLWQSLFAGDRAAIGQLVRADGIAYEIIGVMPAGFRDAFADGVDLWIPYDTAPGGSNRRFNYRLSVVAKAAEGTSFAEVERQIRAARERLAVEDTDVAAKDPFLVPLAERVVGSSQALLYTLLAASGLLLLIACVNLATMLLARGSQRQREFATRAALGSSRIQIVRQLLTESLTLAFFGGLAGMALGVLAVEGLVQIAPAALPRTDNVVFNWRVLLAGCSLTAFTAVLFGWIPSLRASRVNIESSLREASRGGSAGVGQHRLHQGLIAAQVGMAVIVLIGAGLLTKSFGVLLRSELGFSPERVLAFEVSLPQATYPEPAARARFHRRLHEQVETLPGVAAVGATSWLPASGNYHGWGYSLVRGAQQSDWNTDVRIVQGSYFKALGIRLVEGRLSGPQDHADSAPVAIVSESLARRHWPDTTAVGKTIHVAQADRTIVGVVGDTRHDHRIASSVKTYITHDQFAADRNWALIQVVKAEGDPTALLAAIEREIAAIDPTLVVHHARQLEEIVADAIARERFAMLLMSAFGWTALLLAVVGIYGVLSYVVAQRTREIGIRMALGARRREILVSVIGRAVRLTAAGAIAGCVAAALATRWLESLLYEISPTDAAVFAGVVGQTIAAAVFACVGPAARAVNVSPTEALRQE
jgi:predicted permease